MLLLRVTHPPAGAVPLVAMAAPDRALLLFPTLLVSAVVLVGLAILMHRLPPRVTYPRELPPAPAAPPLRATGARLG